ncbi:hypothetical protein [Marivivens marinus]|uniref:hypothetical protein n=1 Tax=Marivivens marinus TaxID=3110173 RepID=UPI003B8452F9
MGRLNIDALSTIVGLKHLALHIDGRKEPVDFARFPDLETLSFSYRTGDCGFECLDRLHWISLWKYKRDTSLREPWLRLPSSIRTLELISSSVENLDLLYPSETLERLKVARFRKLEALPDLAHLFPRLNHLWFEASGRLSVDEVNRATKECRDLEFLCLGKNVLISAMSSN